MKKKIVVAAIVIVTGLIAYACISLAYWEDAEHYHMDTDKETVVNIENEYFDATSTEMIEIINDMAPDYGVEGFYTEPEIIQIYEEGDPDGNGGYEVAINTEYIFKCKEDDMLIKFITVGVADDEKIRSADAEDRIDTIVIGGAYLDEADKKMLETQHKYYRLLTDIFNPSLNTEKFIAKWSSSSFELDGVAFYEWDGGVLLEDDGEYHEYAFGVLTDPEIWDNRDMDTDFLLFPEEYEDAKIQ